MSETNDPSTQETRVEEMIDTPDDVAVAVEEIEEKKEPAGTLRTAATPAGAPRMATAPAGAAREVSVDTDKAHNGVFNVSSLVLIAVLLAAGAILKLTLGSVFTFAGMKPNFIIAMYCLAILLVKPNPWQSLIIGLIAGCICQIPLLNATPLLNILSETVGGLVMGLLMLVPMKIKKVDFKAPVATFIATVASGYTFALVLGAISDANLAVTAATYAPMVFGTALFNAVLVTVLVIPLRRVLKR